jgi:hypothetical protein
MPFGLALREQLTRLAHPPTWDYYRNFPWYPMPIAGCTDEEIAVIMQMQGATHLPELYVEFLRYLGKSPGDLYIGCDLHYRYLSAGNYRGGLNESLTLCGFAPVMEDGVVFMCQQGHTYWFFYTDPQVDDPEVYFFSETLVERGELCERGAVSLNMRLSEKLTEFIAERDSPAAQRAFLAENL